LKVKVFLKKMLNQLTKQGLNNKKIQLEVNKLNIRAINAYKKLAFELIESKETTYIFEL